MPLPRPGNRRDLIGGDEATTAPDYKPEATYAEGYKPQYDLSGSTRGAVSEDIMTAYSSALFKDKFKYGGRMTSSGNFSKYGGRSRNQNLTDDQKATIGNERAYAYAEGANVAGSKKYAKGMKDNPARAAAASYIFKSPKTKSSNRGSSTGMRNNSMTLG